VTTPAWRIARSQMFRVMLALLLPRSQLSGLRVPTWLQRAWARQVCVALWCLYCRCLAKSDFAADASRLDHHGVKFFSQDNQIIIALDTNRS